EPIFDAENNMTGINYFSPFDSLENGKNKARLEFEVAQMQRHFHARVIEKRFEAIAKIESILNELNRLHQTVSPPRALSFQMSSQLIHMAKQMLPMTGEMHRITPGTPDFVNKQYQELKIYFQEAIAKGLLSGADVILLDNEYKLLFTAIEFALKAQAQHKKTIVKHPNWETAIQTFVSNVTTLWAKTESYELELTANLKRACTLYDNTEKVLDKLDAYDEAAKRRLASNIKAVALVRLPREADMAHDTLYFYLDKGLPCIKMHHKGKIMAFEPDAIFDDNTKKTLRMFLVNLARSTEPMTLGEEFQASLCQQFLDKADAVYSYWARYPQGAPIAKMISNIASIKVSLATTEKNAAIKRLDIRPEAHNNWLGPDLRPKLWEVKSLAAKPERLAPVPVNKKVQRSCASRSEVNLHSHPENVYGTQFCHKVHSAGGASAPNLQPQDVLEHDLSISSGAFKL
ncbi:MAG: hypothetical protein K2Q14_06400, partial [Gammaproteobacteria bacterium]|nr:hypothetical protein [Gammaproteobacteria bacterium]